MEGRPPKTQAHPSRQIVAKRTIKKKDSTKEETKRAKSVASLSSYGCTVIDLASGGFPWGRIVNVVGDKSTGKTLLVSEAIAYAKHKYGDDFGHFFDDAEHAYNFDSQLMYGIDILPKNEEDRSVTIEDFMDRIERKALAAKKAGIKHFLYAIDSFDALGSDAEIERTRAKFEARAKGEKVEKGSYNLEKQRSVNQFFRTMNDFFDDNFTLVIISQTRKTIGSLFNTRYRNCEDALNFYSSQVIWLSQVQEYTKLNRTTGICVKAFVKKNKIAKPFRTCFFDILFDYGIDDIASNVDFLLDLRTKKGSLRKLDSIDWDGENVSKKTTEEMREIIIERIIEKAGGKQLSERVEEKWNRIEDEISPKRDKKYK